MKRLYLLDDGEQHYIIATSEEEALRIGKDQYEISAWEDEEVAVTSVPDDKDVVVRYDELEEILSPDQLRDALDLSSEARIDGVTVTATARQWADSGEVGDMIASSIF